MTTEVQIPDVGESVNEVVLAQWLKAEGDNVQADEPVCVLETDKANVELPAPASGTLHPLKQPGETLHVGDTIARIDSPAESTTKKADVEPVRPRESETPQAPGEAERRPQASVATPDHDRAAAASSQREERDSRAPQRIAAKADPPGQTLQAPSDAGARKPKPADTQKRDSPEPPIGPEPYAQSGPARREPMSRIRRRIADRLVQAQHTAAMLTTFNEIDMTAVLQLRARYKERWEKDHRIVPGLVSFFARAVVLALKEFPRLNASIEGEHILFYEQINLGIAVSTDRGLVVPVLRHADGMSLAEIEEGIKRLAASAREGTVTIPDLSGGTFTITNGGIYGSLLSTPILNPPQSGILGMHAIQERPVAIDHQLAIRPMMYVALTYDHRLVDGRESVLFLVRVKDLVEDPMQFVLA
jgi:2-oxoglutarate dehydrogenase E2 component (dihydrolipoamide succinyltransferase)